MPAMLFALGGCFLPLVGADLVGDPAAAGKLAASLLSPLKRLPQSAIRSQ
jgi:hypothetical protein